MKSIIGIIVGAVVLTTSPVVGQTPAQVKSYETPYYPLKVGQRWVYRSGTQNVTLEVEKAETITYKTKSENGLLKDNFVAGFSLKFTSGDKILTEKVAVLENGVFRFKAADKEISPPLCFLVPPDKNGTTWKVESMSENVSLTGVFNVSNVKVDVPAGSFNAVLVKSSEFRIGSDPIEIEAWYVQNKGMVKQRVKVGSHETLMELESAN